MRPAVTAAIAAATVVAAIAAAFLIPGFGISVSVTQMDVQASGTCGLGSMLVESGFTLPPDGEEQFSSAGVVAPDCVIDSITSNTSGFEVTWANVPYRVGEESVPLQWTVQGPLAYHGPLVMVVHGNQTPGRSDTNGTTSCGNAPPCVSSQIPYELYLFSWGEVLPSGWMLLEATSLGALVSAVAWGTKRKP